MNNLPTRRLSNASLHNHHPIRIPPSNRFTNSLNRMESSSTRFSPLSIFDPFLSRFPRRARLFSLILILFVGSFFWFKRSRPSNHWKYPFSSIESTSDPNVDHQPVPTVTRDVLQRLEELSLSEFNDEERAVEELLYADLIQSNRTFHPGLPFVTSLPTDRRISSSNSNQNDIQICPDHLPYPCRFLVAGYVGEQETKAQIHLHQLGLLALALNRTLVLPQISQSRMGSCLEHPFDFYYQPDALHRLGVKTLTHDKFLDWFTNSNSNIPSARLVAIVNRQQVPSSPSQGSIYFDQSSPSNNRLHFQPERQFCLRNNKIRDLNPKIKSKLTFNFDSFNPLIIVSPEKWHRSVQNREKFSEKIIQSIRDSDSRLIDKNLKTGRLPIPESSTVSRPNILVVNYELRHAFLDPISQHSQNLMGIDSLKKIQEQVEFKLEKFQHFPYASIWVEFVQALLKPLPSIIGVHWRQENIGTADLKKCAQTLITTLESIKKNYPSLQSIYLSTDYPIEKVHQSSKPLGYQQQREEEKSSSRAHSGTFTKLITEEHDRIMQHLINTAFSTSLSWLTFNSLIDNLELSSEMVHKLIQSPGFQDIKEMDRMMKMSQFDRQGQYKHVENENEIKRLMKEKFKLQMKEGQGGEELETRENQTIDIGIIGILEKLILIKSNFFLTGVPNQCSKSSSYTHHIIEDRQLFIDQTFIQYGYLLDLDSFYSNSINTKANFNLVEFWS